MKNSPHWTGVKQSVREKQISWWHGQALETNVCSQCWVSNSPNYIQTWKQTFLVLAVTIVTFWLKLAVVVVDFNQNVGATLVGFHQNVRRQNGWWYTDHTTHQQLLGPNQGFQLLCPRMPWRSPCFFLAPENSSQHIQTKGMSLPTRWMKDYIKEKGRKEKLSSAKRGYNRRQQIS